MCVYIYSILRNNTVNEIEIRIKTSPLKFQMSSDYPDGKLKKKTKKHFFLIFLIPFLLTISFNSTSSKIASSTLQQFITSHGKILNS